uniref:Secreted protein n=1 Tax=Globodera pallida TaxID=36090 RepID=A0A183BN95_GLOPA
MHPKEAIIVLLLVLALCRCCVGGPKPRKGKGSTGFPLSREDNNAMKRVVNSRKQQQPVDNHTLPTHDNPGYTGVQVSQGGASSSNPSKKPSGSNSTCWNFCGGTK